MSLDTSGPIGQIAVAVILEAVTSGTRQGSGVDVFTFIVGAFTFVSGALIVATLAWLAFEFFRGRHEASRPDMPDFGDLLRDIRLLIPAIGPQAQVDYDLAQITIAHTIATLAAKKSADRYARVLVIATIAVLLLTAVLVVLTWRLVTHGG